MQAGADEFVKKPFDIKALVNRMVELLGLATE
jgi:DNA-binding response OmpR family regulator